MAYGVSGSKMQPRRAYALLVPAVACGCLLWGFLSYPQSDAQKKSSSIDFRDITEAAGIDFTNVCGRPHQADYILESTGCGAAVFDSIQRASTQNDRCALSKIPRLYGTR